MTRPLGYTAAVGVGGGAVSSVAGRTGDVVLAVADVSGAQPTMTTQSKTANFNAAAGVIYLVDTTSGAVTATLPSANVAGQKIALKWVGGTSAFTVARSGSDTIGSATTSATLSLLNEIWELTSSGTGQWNLTGGNKTLSALDGRYANNWLTTGEESLQRELMTSAAVPTSSGIMRLTYFTARKTETSTQCRVWTGSTAAAATPTLCRIGIFEIAANGDGTLVAATANDTTLFAAATTSYTRSWATPFAKTAGKRYAMGALVVTGVAAPSFAGQTIAIAAESSVSPLLGWTLTGLADIPASFASTTGSINGNRPYGVVLP